MKIAVVTPIPVPYRDAYWNALTDRPDVDLSVYYCARSKGDRPWEANWEMRYHNEVLPGKNLLRWWNADASVFWNPDVVKRLSAGQYDAVIIAGYNHLTLVAALRYCRREKIPYYLLWETHESKNRGIKGWIREKLVKWVLSRAAGVFPTGQLARRFLGERGVGEDRMMSFPNIPDVAALTGRVERLRPERKALREKHGLDPERTTVVFVGRLIRKKRADDLIAALGQVPAEQDFQLLVVGDGEQRSDLEAQARQSIHAGRIHFAGFVEPENVDKIYALGDIFVLPSHETWGVVVIEALASGLQVIVSNRAGCHPDVSHCATVFEFGDVDGLAKALQACFAREGRKGDQSGLPAGWSFGEIAEKMAAFFRATAAP